MLNEKQNFPCKSAESAHQELSESIIEELMHMSSQRRILAAILGG